MIIKYIKFDFKYVTTILKLKNLLHRVSTVKYKMGNFKLETLQYIFAKVKI